MQNNEQHQTANLVDFSCHLKLCCFIQNLVHELKNARSYAADDSCLQKQTSKPNKLDRQ